MSAPLRRRRRSQATAISLRPWTKRRVFSAIGVLLIAAGLFAGYQAWDAYRHVNSKAGLGDFLGALQNQEDQVGTLAYKVRHGQRVNILLLGYGGAGHDGGYLTDSIQVLSVQGTDRVALTSLPRDTFVKIKAFANDGTYEGKVNAAFEIPLSKGAFGHVSPTYDDGFDGGGRLASKVVGDYLGLQIDYWVSVDFTAFKRVVDAIGGVDVVNPYVLDDPTYPLGETGGYTHIHINAGAQHLDGDHALIYVRERHADSDFGRARRQQQVMAAIKDKAVKVDAIPKMYDLLGALKDNVHTNLSLNDLKVFGSVAGKVSSPNTHHVSIDNTTMQYDTLDSYAGYILLPRDHTMSYLHHYIQSEMVDPKVLGENATVQFSSSPPEASGSNSFGDIWTSLLGMLNFKVATPASTRKSPTITEIHDYSGGKASKTVRWLASYFGATVITETPGSSAPAPLVGASPSATAGGPDVVVDLGTEFANGFDAEERPIYSPPPYNYVPPAPRRPSPSPSAVPSAAPTEEPQPSPSTHPIATPCFPPNSPHCKPTPAGGPTPSPQESPPPPPP